MSAAPISAAEAAVPAPVRAALERAGWPVQAWIWEQALAAALEAAAEGARERALASLDRAHALGEQAFPAVDLRRVTAAADRAMLRGDRAELGRLAALWEAGEGWLAALSAPRSGARSSLFHLRLETKHAGGYARLATDRLARSWQEGRAALAEAGGPGVSEAGYREQAHALLRRWSGTKARMGFTDERKIAAAAGLLLRPAADPGRAPA